jgi:HAD superfamily hydrolase (TIGR01490 family)
MSSSSRAPTRSMSSTALLSSPDIANEATYDYDVRAAFFDLDKTVIAKTSLGALGPEFHARGLIRRWTLIRGIGRQLWFLWFGADENKLDKIRVSLMKLTKGWDRDEVRLLVTETLNEVIEPLIYAEALEIIEHHLAVGDEVWIVSSSPVEVVDPFADLLKLTGSIGSRAEIDDENRYTGEMEFFNQGENKAVAIREIAAARDIDLSISSAYSDSETDLPMLEVVGHPYAVNPDRTLARIAHERAWPILTFSKPVRAHDRRNSHTPVIVGALIVGVVSALGVFYRGVD